MLQRITKKNVISKLFIINFFVVSRDKQEMTLSTRVAIVANKSEPLSPPLVFNVCVCVCLILLVGDPLQYIMRTIRLLESS